MARKKISRKKLKKTDEFVSTAEKIVNYIRENPSKAAAAAGTLILLMVIAWGARSYMGFRKEKILRLEAEANMLYEEARGNEEKVPDALNLLENVYRKYPRTISGQTSLYRAANLNYYLNDYQKALEKYEILIEKHGDNELIYPLALQSMAYCFEQLEDLNSARESYEKLLSMEIELPRAQLYMDLGRIYEKSGNSDKARASYREVLDNYPDSTWSDLAESKLGKLAVEGE